MKAEAFWSRVADLSSPTFLNQDRSLCQYLQTPTLGNLARGKCSLCVSGASYRNEIHQKWLRIDPGGSGYAVTDIQNTANFASYVAPGGARIPLAPLIVALYHDADPGLVLGARTAVSSADFAADFNFSQPEMATYFETSMAHPLTKKYVGWRACHSQCHGNPHGLAGSAVVRDQIRVRISTYFLVTPRGRNLTYVFDRRVNNKKIPDLVQKKNLFWHFQGVFKKINSSATLQTYKPPPFFSQSPRHDA